MHGFFTWPGAAGWVRADLARVAAVLTHVPLHTPVSWPCILPTDSSFSAMSVLLCFRWGGLLCAVGATTTAGTNIAWCHGAQMRGETSVVRHVLGCVPFLDAGAGGRVGAAKDE